MSRRRDMLLSERGFTLIELMITAAILAIAMIAYLGTVTTIHKTSEKAFEEAVAAQDASQVIGQIRNAANTGTFPSNAVSAFPNNGTVAGFSNLTNEQVTVTYTDASANPLDVTVLVTWNTNDQRVASTAVRTLITQRVTS